VCVCVFVCVCGCVCASVNIDLICQCFWNHLSHLPISNFAGLYIKRLCKQSYRLHSLNYFWWPAGVAGMGQNGAFFDFSQITLELRADPLQCFDILWILTFYIFFVLVSSLKNGFFMVKIRFESYKLQPIWIRHIMWFTTTADSWYMTNAGCYSNEVFESYLGLRDLLGVGF